MMVSICPKLSSTHFVAVSDDEFTEVLVFIFKKAYVKFTVLEKLKNG